MNKVQISCGDWDKYKELNATLKRRIEFKVSAAIEAYMNHCDTLPDEFTCTAGIVLDEPEDTAADFFIMDTVKETLAKWEKEFEHKLLKFCIGKIIINPRELQVFPMGNKFAVLICFTLCREKKNE